MEPRACLRSPCDTSIGTSCAAETAVETSRSIDVDADAPGDAFSALPLRPCNAAAPAIASGVPMLVPQGRCDGFTWLSATSAGQQFCSATASAVSAYAAGFFLALARRRTGKLLGVLSAGMAGCTRFSATRAPTSWRVPCGWRICAGAVTRSSPRKQLLQRGQPARRAAGASRAAGVSVPPPRRGQFAERGGAATLGCAQRRGGAPVYMEAL